MLCSHYFIYDYKMKRTVKRGIFEIRFGMIKCSELQLQKMVIKRNGRVRTDDISFFFACPEFRWEINSVLLIFEWCDSYVD